MAAANLAAALVRRGHRVDYVTTQYPGLSRVETWEGVTVYREPVIGRKDLHTATIISMLSYPPVAVRRARALAGKYHYDIIHTHFAIPTGPAGYLVSKSLGLPNVLSVYGGDIYDPSKRYSPHRHPGLKRVVKAVVNQASVIIGESSDICDRTHRYFTPDTPIKRIPLGFETPVFQEKSRSELGISVDLMYAVAVSRLISRKDYATLLKAFARADVSNMRLIIIGDGPERSAMNYLVTALKINDRVEFKGSVSDQEKFGYLSQSDIFVLSPLHEGYGIVYQEAMYFGLPIVTTNVGGQTDFLQDGRNALLTGTGDVDAMAKSIQKMASDGVFRKRLGENNRRDIQEQMIDAVAARYEELFMDILQEKQVHR